MFALSAYALLVVLPAVAAQQVGVTQNVSEAPSSDVQTERWYVIRFDDQPVGYERIVTVNSETSETIRHVRKTRLNLKRLGDDLSLQATLTTSESLSGSLTGFELYRIDGAGRRMERSGELTADRSVLAIEEKVQATRRKYSQKVPREMRSPILEQWIGRAGLGMGDRAVFTVFFPETVGAADLIFEFKTSRTVRLHDGSRPELQVVQFAPVADPLRRTTLYLDHNGDVVRSEKRLLGGLLTMEVGSADTALNAASGRSLDLEIRAAIPVDRSLRKPTTSRAVVLELESSTPMRIAIPQAPEQRVETISENLTRVTLLRASKPDTRQPSRKTNLAPTRWMPSDDYEIQRLAHTAAGVYDDDYEVCRRMEQYLRSRMKRSAFSSAMTPASSVARNLTGDCTEHAVLLATMMRVHGIPSRIVTGIVYQNQGFGFVGHMWVEALVNNEWRAFDSATGQEGVGTSHLKLADSELPDSLQSTVSLFLPVLDLAGQATIRIIAER